MSGALTIGQLITGFKTIQLRLKESGSTKDIRVLFDFPEIYPTKIASWRGVYSEPALGYAVATSYLHYESPTIEDMLTELETSLRTRYEGWKGGEYTFTKDSVVHVDNPGMCNERVIVEMVLNDDNVILITREG